jgi:two-component system, LuxR family, response regulator TtrR
MSDRAETGSARPDPLSTVYVVDDDEAVRDSVRFLLEAGGYTVEPFDSAEAFLSGFDADALACVIVDVRMPGMSGLELQEELLRRGVPMPIVIVTGHGDVQMAVATMKKGAADFIEKPFDQNALKTLVDRLLTRARTEAGENERTRMSTQLIAQLTPREQQVLGRIAAGRLNKQIATDLGISIKTVEAHRANIMSKLRANTVADLMRVVLQAKP